ncbi:MAG: Lon protease family protein [Anaerolineae bacterium]
MTASQLSSAKLKRVCDPSQFSFETTADLTHTPTAIIGQPRATEALRFGLEIPSRGYNIYVLGQTSMGHRETVEKYLRCHAKNRPVPNDWVYVNNFETTHKPKVVSFPAGEGMVFCKEIEELLAMLKKEVPAAFDTDSYRSSSDKIRQQFQNSRDDLIDELRKQVKADGLTAVRTSSGLTLVPLLEGRAMTADELDQIPVDDQSAWQKKRQAWEDELDEVLRKIRDLDTKTTDEMSELERTVASEALSQRYDELKEKYQAQTNVVEYLDESLKNVLDNLTDFFPPEADETPVDLRNYEVNLLVDHSETVGAPVITELNPRYHNLMGRIEYESQHTTHFSNIRPGALHQANGGYLVINVNQLLASRNGWGALRRALTTGEVLLQPSDRAEGNQVLTKSLDPAPIPLNIKVVLIGDYNTWVRLYRREDNFDQLFKVKAEFASTMARTPESEQAYVDFVASVCREENNRPFDPTAVARVIDYGAWWADHQDKLSTDFEALTDLINESCFWAGSTGRETVTAADVQLAIDKKTSRSNLVEEEEFTRIKDGIIYVDTHGAQVGQINALSVYTAGDYAFGIPGRLTARTWQGEPGIAHIERETDMAGPVHNKGVLTLIGFMGGQYAQDQRLNFAASLTFEQQYGGVDGDSASAAELIVLLSSLGNFPVKQNIAITGSINQKGAIQPIGGVNEKVLGFYDVCVKGGLTGDQGVIIPAVNQHELMLEQRVVDAVEAGQFSIWTVETVFDAIELLTDAKVLPADDEGTYPEGSLHALVFEGLDRLNSTDHDGDEDDEESEETDQDTNTESGENAGESKTKPAA